MSTHFIVRPIPESVAADARVRAAKGDRAVQRQVVDTYPAFPCRRCLRDGEVGEGMLLFSYTPFETNGPYAETGPIFVHERVCTPASLDIDEAPEVTRVREQVVVRAYDHAGAIHGATLATSADAPGAIRAFLDDDRVAYAHVRSVTYGCFTYRADRAPAPNPA